MRVLSNSRLGIRVTRSSVSSLDPPTSMRVMM
jgi:hypothetical protein